VSDLQDIRDTFDLFDDWEDKYRFLIELGKDLVALPDEYRTDANLIRGCQSQVWLVTTFDPSSGHLKITLDSDAHIVRGLSAVVLTALNHKTPAEILQFDIDGLFAELDLLQHLSPTRGNGLRAMVAKVRQHAEQAS
jgi:cysteine desulfuration protein SufE